MKNKTPLLIGLVVLMLLVIGGGYFFLAGRSTDTEGTDEPVFDENVETLSPDEIGLEMVASGNKKQVKFIINNPDGITGVDYEMTYVAGDGQQRGVIGTIEEIGGNTIESKYLDLGSCSSGTCKYDTGVTSVNLLLKITKDDGKLYQVEDSLEL